jgi:hypothetical protein
VLEEGPPHGPAQRRPTRAAALRRRPSTPAAGAWELRAAAALAATFSPLVCAQDDGNVLQRLEQLEQRQTALEQRLAERDARIRELEAELRAREAPLPPRVFDDVDAAAVGGRDTAPVVEDADAESPRFGIFQSGGRGFKVADTSFGELNFSAWAYARYLYQKELDPTYTDSFGRTRELDLRNDMQLNKVNLYMKGWLFDPRFRYVLYTWTANTSQGESSQVVVAGNLSYNFNEKLDLGFGINALPGTRTLNGTFPNWLKVDTRPIADEFFRPSYTTGVFASGAITPELNYRVMIGNNLSQLGVSAAQLDGDFNTYSAALSWAPATGEFGPGDAFGDFEEHQELATLFGVHVTRSREDAQGQPGTDAIENSQIRLSDGTVIFQPDAFATGGRINRATYLMSSLNAGMKYRGFSLEGDLYFRWVDSFATEGVVPVDELYDRGFQLSASMMAIPRKLQAYVAMSKVYGEYGDPYDFSVGMNWFPLGQKLLRVNTEVQYLKNSPVGYASVPFLVGANGTVFYTNLEMMF